MNVIIVGAGIGGLVSALCLDAKGHKVKIYEQAEILSELGAGIQLSPNANKVLKYLGVMEELQEDVYEPDAFQLDPSILRSVLYDAIDENGVELFERLKLML